MSGCRDIPNLRNLNVKLCGKFHERDEEHNNERTNIRTDEQYYTLDPVHYFSSPGFAWDAMLKMTNINLELITDIDMYQMVEKSLLWE